MPLQSQLLRGDSKLEAAATSDPAHIVPGADGEHVRKIQAALIKLDSANIQPDGKYGQATADAVLSYKRKRNIVNRTYQTTADNIVGKMTIAALDSELLARDSRPIVLRPLHPSANLRAVAPSSGRPFGITGPSSVPNLKPSVFPTFQETVIIAQGGVGTIQVLGAAGGRMLRTQDGENFSQVASLRGSKSSERDSEVLDISQDPTTVTYDALNCGEVFFMAFVDPQKLSALVRLLSLVAVSNQGLSTELIPPPAKGLSKGLVSTQGTPLNPLPGRKVNLFGEKETNGFEDYSSDIDHCSAGSGRLGGITIHRPWTHDPRPLSGIADKSVANICGRGSPMKPVTIEEIKRIGRSGCRVTYADASGSKNVDRLRAAFLSTGLAKPIDEGLFDDTGRAIVFELN